MMPSTKSDSFSSSSPIWVHFLFSHLIALASIAIILLGKSGKIEPPLSIMLAVGLSYMTSLMVRYVLSIPIFDIEFCEMFFLHSLIVRFLSLILLI